MPLVSIIMPAYNRADLIHYAIDSIVSQTISDWELILINDASEDATLPVMESYARRGDRIRVISNEVNSRHGPIQWEPRNDGLRIARGSFIAYLDADNTWRPQFLECLSEVLLHNDELQLAHCDSCNHYSASEAREVIARDPRRLVDSGPTWTVYSHSQLDVAKLGVEQYVDTNEMMHRASVFSRLDGLWRTFHPRRQFINQQQLIRCPYRRHNDLELFERIVDAFGTASVFHLPEVQVDFFYPSADRKVNTSDYSASKDQPHYRAGGAVHPQLRTVLQDLDASHFYSDYLVTPPTARREVAQGRDFGLGEIDGIDGLNLAEIYRRFVEQGGLDDLLIHYNGSMKVRATYSGVAAYYNREIGSELFDVHSVIPFDGCHNALENAVSVFTGTPGCTAGRDAVAYPVPSYPYWTLAAAARRRSVPIEAYDGQTLLSGFERLSISNIGAVIIHHPGNPLGYVLDEEQLAKLGFLARHRDWGIIVDATYGSFLDGSCPLASLRVLPMERTVLCGSVSKAWGMPGLRLGFGLSADPDLAAVLRAHKSGQSLLPSSLKQRFFGHVLSEFEYIPTAIKAAVHHRKAQARRLLASHLPPDCGVDAPQEFHPGPFDVLFVDDLCRASGQDAQQLAAWIMERAGIKIVSGGRFFPPSFPGTPARQFLRLSFGAVTDVEPGIIDLITCLRELVPMESKLSS